MFIAHMPAGYLLTIYVQNKTGNHSPLLFWVGLIASIFPDFDLVYFYLIDHRQTPHHQYLTHMPIAWLTVALFFWSVLKIIDKPRLIPYIGVALANGLLHIALDSIMAGIYWFYPFSEVEVNLLQITKHYDWWWLNFVLHWTFMAEIFIALLAFHVWMTHAEECPDR